MAAVETDALAVLPKHLRDGHYKGAEALGHVGYKFPHGDPRGWVVKEYVPGLRPGTYYQSDAPGGATFEARADQFWEETTGARQARTFGK
jgi:putative ATPase